MTTYVEWIEPYSTNMRIAVVLRLRIRDVVRLQFDRHPDYPSAQCAIDDFIAIHWARLIENYDVP